MAWYTTGTIAVSGTTVTGTGTNFLDNTQSIGPGQALLIPGSGTVKMYEVASVQSATKLTLKTTAGTVAAGQAYAILSFYTDSVPDFARRLAAQLSYYQSQMDGWQQIMTGTGSITMTAPDGTSVTISSFSKLTADIASAFLQKGVIATGVDTNSLGSDSFGVWSIGSTAAQSNPNLPEANQGVLEVMSGGLYGCTQRFTARYGNVWVRTLGATWNASSPTWNAWYLVGDQPVQGYQADANLCVTPGTYSFAASSTNNTPAAVTGILEVKLRLSTSSVKQTFTYIGTNATYINRTWQRTLSGTTWSAWAESLTTNSVVAIANGGTGAATASAARTALALNYSNSAANPGGGVYRLFMTDDSGRMCITRRFNVTAKANSATAFSYSWSDDGAGTYVGYPGCSVMGESGNSANFKVGVESLTNAKVSGFIHNTGTTDLSVWLTFLVIGIKA